VTELEKVHALAKILDSKKGRNIIALDLGGATIIADYFVICSGTSSTHVKALADEVEYQLGGHEADIGFNKEGYGTGTWILMDYRDIIVHIMFGETRDFYNLEHLWSDGKEIDISEFMEE